MARTVGIDLGTTNSVIAIMDGAQPTVITNSDGGRTTPSIVGFAKDGEVLVGEVAKRQQVANPDRTFRSVKRHMGDGTWRAKIGDKELTAQEISARILQKLKRDVEAFTGEEVARAVITVPAYFNDAQRTATKEAGQIAGLEVLRTVNEPTAAALAYGLDKAGAQTIVVFDLGGGTLDVSVLSLGDGTFHVKATSGDTHLGGDDWDQAIVDWLLAEFQRGTGIDLSSDAMALQRMAEAAEAAKKALSTIEETTINIPFLTADATGPKHLEMPLTRAKFETITAKLLERCREPFAKALADASIKAEKLDQVVLVGGSTRMPAVQKLVADLAGKEPYRGVNPDEVVAMGAALQAGVLSGTVNDLVLLDVTPLPLGVETQGEVMTTLIERNTTIPTRRSEVFTTAEDGQQNVEVHVLQGVRAMARDNLSLGRFTVEILPAPRGVPQIEVSFDIDANGIVHVSAKDKGTGKEQSITISGCSSLPKAEITRMVSEAADHEVDDRRRRERAEVRNRAEALRNRAERLLAERGPSTFGSEPEEVRAQMASLEQALARDDLMGLRAAMEALDAALIAMGEAIYRAGAQVSTL